MFIKFFFKYIYLSLNDKPFKVLYEDCLIGTIAASSAGSTTFQFANIREKSAIWICDCSDSNRVGIIYMIKTDSTDNTQILIWYYNTRTQSANNCVARIYYTLT